jgi:mannose-6-phosphate isomerase-like protein (cupin superfamily)
VRVAGGDNGVMSQQDYDIQLDVKYPHGTLIDVSAEAAAHEPWFNQTLTQIDDAVVRLGIIEGDFHWHKHDDQDEFFLVLEGQLLIDVEGADTVTLNPNQAFSVAKGVVHRTRAPQGRTVILMVERAGVIPTGD